MSAAIQIQHENGKQNCKQLRKYISLKTAELWKWKAEYGTGYFLEVKYDIIKEKQETKVSSDHMISLLSWQNAANL